MKKVRWALMVALSLALTVSAASQYTRSTGRGGSIDPGGITFRGTGASSGDAIKLTVAPRGKGGPRDVVLNVPPGTRLQSSSGGAQSMVVAGVRGRSLGGSGGGGGGPRGGERFTPVSEIRGPGTYILEAYCAEFHKDNPSSRVTFKLGGQNRDLACIFREAGGLSVAAKQAAVWIYTDHVTYGQMSAKFPVSQSEWRAALEVIKRCKLAAGTARKQKPPAPRGSRQPRPVRRPR